MKRLADKRYWDSVYAGSKSRQSSQMSFFGLRESLKRLTRDYSNYVIWEVLLKKYLPVSSSLKMVEIGCAPGKYLVHFNKLFRYMPFGVEYSEEGIRATKENFKKAGLPEENILQADFFDPVFLSDNSRQYDIVFSRGFIEHYDMVDEVVEAHYKLLKQGGYLVVMIPNLNGANSYLARFLNVDSYKLHNTSIMDKRSFRELFPEGELEPMYCDYVGIFSFGVFNTNRRWKYYIYRILLLIQRPFDLLFRILRLSILKNRYTSPYLLFIGRKI